MAPVGSGSGTTPVYTHIQKFSTTTPVVAAQNGYIYIFVSNESNLAVFFDNLTVRHTPGPILEETQYYPFGLTMARISSKAMGKLQNRFKFNDGTELESKEFSDGSGLDLYATEFRSYDPQIGRFLQIDPLSEATEGFSPYSFAEDNPLLFNDPLGLQADSAVPNVPLMTEVIVTPRADFNPCLSCKLPAPDPSKAIPEPETLPDNNKGLLGEQEDNKGLFRTAPKELYDYKPLKAFIIDVGFAVSEYYGINSFDNFIADRIEGRNSTGDYIRGFAGIISASIRGEKPPKGTRPPNLAPHNSGRRGALREALRRNGVPTSMQPTRVLPNKDRRGNLQPGRIYEYDIVGEGGGIRVVRIRDDAAGHSFPDDPSQNRSSHFNDESGHHYDYK